jgi:hypothetical protein
MLASAVAAGAVSALQAWPELFPAGDGEEDFSAGGPDGGLRLEQATPESFAADMAALVESSRRVTVREPGRPPGPDPGHQYVPDPEWT